MDHVDSTGIGYVSVVSTMGLVEAEPAISIIRARVKRVFDADPMFAACFTRPLRLDIPEHPLLDRMDLGEFQD